MVYQKKPKRKEVSTKFDAFRQQEKAALGLIKAPSTRRPLLASTVLSVPECEKWRTDVTKEIVSRVQRIVDPTLDEVKVRDLNDLINRLFRNKKMWEMRIKELGGPDYGRSATNDMGMGGMAVPGTKGYRYFGRAKQLPGVKELFEQAATMQEKVSAIELQQRVDADYYGYRDEDDGILLNYESSLQDQNREAILQESKEEEQNDLFHLDFIAPPQVPDQTEFEAFLVERKRKEMELKYL